MGNGAAGAVISGDELLGELEDPEILILDVREPDEFADWRIPGARNIPLGELESRLDELSGSGENDVVVVCAQGTRAARGAEILRRHGRAARVLDGGMGAWASTYDTVDVELAGARVVQLRRRGKGCLSYVIGAGERALVIDPSLETSRYLDVAAANGWRVTDILDTHLHADHVSGARKLAAASGATLWLNAADHFTFDFAPLRDGHVIELAPNVGLRVASVSVPGHTEGSTMYQLGDAAVFTGDTLFLESVGRPDLADQAEPFAHSLYRSLHERVMPLPDGVLVFPAHYGASVEVHAKEMVARALGELRATLPALHLSEEEFVTWAVERVTDRPPNYQHIVAVNAGVEELTGDPAELESGPNRCAIA